MHRLSMTPDIQNVVYCLYQQQTILPSLIHHNMSRLFPDFILLLDFQRSLTLVDEAVLIEATN